MVFAEDDEDIKLADDSFDEEDDFDPAPPRKRRRQSKLSRFAQSFVLICVFVGVAVFLAYFALVTASDLLGLGQTDQQIEVTLTEEDAASLSRTADVLEQNGVISSKLVFELYARLKDMEGTFQAKTFVLNNKWGYDQIMNHLAYDSEESDIVTVTFREGMTQQQIGELLEENNVCTRRTSMTRWKTAITATTTLRDWCRMRTCASASMRATSSRIPTSSTPT